jgi:DNA topoisomerase-1
MKTRSSPVLPRRTLRKSLPLSAPAGAPVAAARAAGLRYVRDDRPGLRRVRCGKGVRYLDPEGRIIRDPETLARIRSLAIPPAWTDVWICPLANGHLQATGRDARDRKQFRYHPRWRAVRDETKYHRLIAFGLALPRVRDRVEIDLARPGLPRSKVLATVVRLLEATLIRVGNEEYVKANHSFGLTTLRNRHARVEGTTVCFTFRGKSGVRHRIDVRDRKLARIVRRCQELPGQELFEYVDEDGAPCRVDSADVNEYLREIAGEEFTAKDFRTWGGTVLAARALAELPPFESATQAKHNIVAASRSVAERLGNTPTLCRKCYIHPAVLEVYAEGKLREALGRRLKREGRGNLAQLSDEEAAVLALLRERLKQERKAAAS